MNTFLTPAEIDEFIVRLRATVKKAAAGMALRRALSELLRGRRADDMPDLFALAERSQTRRKERTSAGSGSAHAWSGRQGATPTPSDENAVYAVLRNAPGGLAMKDLLAATSIPEQTLRRRLRALAAQGRLRISGVHRSTRYHAVESARERHAANGVGPRPADAGELREAAMAGGGVAEELSPVLRRRHRPRGASRSLDSGDVERVLQIVRRMPGLRADEIVVEAAPLEPVLAHQALGLLVKSGAIVRSGRGPASRYNGR